MTWTERRSCLSAFGALPQLFPSPDWPDVDPNPNFRELLRQEALECIRTGDVETGRSILEKYIGGYELSETTKSATRA